MLQALFHIKLPQLIGIIAGCTVFTITISVVIYLLYASGTIHGLIKELQSNEKIDDKKKSSNFNDIISDQPKLHDFILETRNKLNKIIQIKSIKSKSITVDCLTKDNKFINELFIASNGSPLFSESAYPPIKLWGFVDVLDQKPWESLEQFKSYYDQDHQKSHIIIIDNELIKPIGILSLWNNEINNLTIQIENIWITPAYQGRKKAHETILIILGYLFKINYRRISVEVDSRHLIAKKLFIRCGFLLEGTLRKHKIINDRNRDTCIYSIINSDWLDVETSLKKHVGIPTIIKKEKIASIDTSIRFTPDLTNKENKFNDNNISDSHDTSSNSTTAVNKKKKKRCK